VEAGRSAAVFPQTLALLAIKIGLPLKTILMIYSASFILLYYIIYLIITHLFRLSRLALAVPLLLLLGVKYSFFWISTETHQALVYTIFFYAFLTWSLGFRNNFIFSTIRVVVATGILWLCFYSHPVALFTVLFVLGYYIIENRRWLKVEGYLLGTIIIAVALHKVLSGSSGDYESFYFKGFGEFFTRLGDLHHSESLKFLRSNLRNIYLIPSVLFLSMVTWYAVKRAWLKLGYYLGFSIAFSLVLFTTFDLWYYPFIQEKNLMGLNIILLIPFLREVEFKGEVRRLFMQIFLVLIFLSGLGQVVRASRFYKDRLAYIHELIGLVRQFPEKKFILPEDLADRNRLNVFWGLAPETLLLSSLESPDSSVTIYINDTQGKLPDDTNLGDSLLFICTPWAKDLKSKWLDKRYFHLANSGYRVLTEQDLIRGDEIEFYSNSFSDRTFHKGRDSCKTDVSGNSCFETTAEFSPGLYGLYADVIKHPAVLITAEVMVFPQETLNPKWLALVISREKNNVVLEYRSATVQPPDSLKIGQWNSIRVSGRISSTDKEDELKVYLWNPEKKRVWMDDIRATYRVLR